MRHLLSAALALVLGPVVYVASGFGLTGLANVPHDNGGAHLLNAVLGISTAGVAYAFLLLPRLSPVGPGLTGLAFAVIGVANILTAISPLKDLDFGIAAEEHSGRMSQLLAPLLAVPLLAALAVLNRWRDPAPPHPAPAYPDPADPNHQARSPFGISSTQ